MSKAVLLSVRPKHCYDIAIYDKKLEIRKRIPTLKTPFKVYLYCTKGSKHEAFTVDKYGNSLLIACCDYNTAIPVGCEIANGKVFGEFTCNEVEEFVANCKTAHIIRTEQIAHSACISMDKLVEYGYKSSNLYAWHISDLVIYDKPKELSEFINYDRCPYGGLIDCKKCEKHHCLKRPPQSWCYVEEITTDC